jgi:arylsulfatase
MPEVFAAGGYRTALFGKWHLGDNYPCRPQDRGFEESIWFPSSHIPSAAGYWNNDYFDDVYEHNGVNKPFKGYCTDVFFREAMQWMGQRAARRERFFCYLPVNAPHAPLFVPDSYREPYRKQRPAIRSFFAMIANIDENMGKLETFLRDTGLRDNTILIFMTDNGTATGDRLYNAGMRGKKQSLYDGGHRVPLFVRWPGGKLRAPVDLGQLTECQDVLPTLIDLCGLKAPRTAKFDGASLAKLLRGRSDALPDRMLVTQFSRMDRPQPWAADAAVLWQHWRLVTNTELFDISTDPGQEHNVIGQFPDVAAKMRRHYDRWWAGVAEDVNHFSLIHVGSPRSNPVRLTPCDWQDVFLDQQAQIRTQRRNGPWGLFVEQDGQYEFSLRRWPIEEDAALTDALPEYRAVDGVYPAGEAIPIARAEIRIGGLERSAVVAPGDKQVTFNVTLKHGPTRLTTVFRDAAGQELCGAYYVYVRPSR